MRSGRFWKAACRRPANKVRPFAPPRIARVASANSSPRWPERRSEFQGLSGPTLFIANHTSHLDAPTVLRALPSDLRQRVAVAAAADYFFTNRRLSFVTSLLLNGFPFSRDTAVRESLEYCGE